MNRRLFMASAVALIAAPQLAVAGGAGTVDYTPGLIKEMLAAGETVFVDYSAKWCGTCKRQERAVGAIRAANKDFDANMSFVRVDWDQYSSHEVASSRNIPRRSTLIVLRGEEELGRIVAGTGIDEIKALMELGLPGA